MSETTETPLTFGLIGLGYWGPNLLRVLADMPDAEVKWLCDLDVQRLERFGRRYPGSSQTTDVDALLEDPEVDALVIATPVFTHFDLASRRCGPASTPSSRSRWPPPARRRHSSCALPSTRTGC